MQESTQQPFDAQPPSGNYRATGVRYDLQPEELLELESDLLAEVRGAQDAPGIAAVWIGPDHPYSNILRAYEAAHFPEVAELPQDIEDRSLFLALVDSRPGIERVIHSTTVSGVVGRKMGEPMPGDGTGESVTSGFIVIDDLIEMGNFTKEEFWSFYEAQGVDLLKSISVETNNRVGEKVEDFQGVRTSDLAYLQLFKLLSSRNTSEPHGVVFASINGDSIRSFERFGIQCDPLMGRTDLVTSESLQGLDYQPVAIPDNAELFRDMNLGIVRLTFNVDL